MTLTDWFRRLLGTNARPTSRKPLRPRARPRLEVLEDRLTPANAISIINGGLTTIPAGATTFADTGTYSIAPSAFTGAGNVTLRANGDIGVANALPTLASGQSLTFQAGRSIDIGGNIQGSNAAFAFTANDPTATQAQRPAGDALLRLLAGFSVSNTGGTVTFTGGTGDSAGANTHPNCPVRLDGVNVTASGGITMTGRGNATNPAGIDIRGTTVNSNGGNVSLTGTGTGLGVGIGVGTNGVDSGTVQTSGAGTVTLNGTGRNGVEIGAFPGSGGVSTVDGLLSITGNSPSSNDSSAYGIFMFASGTFVRATGTGGVTLNGTGSPNSTGGRGVYIVTGATVSVNNGPLSITGTSQNAAALGVRFSENSTVRSLGSGTISILGTAPGNTAAISFADLGFGGATLTTNTGTVTLQGNVINLGAANSVSSTGAALLQFGPPTIDRPIILGGGNVAGSLVFTNTNLAALSGFGRVSIGVAGSTAPITTAANLTFASNLSVGTGGGTGAITITHALNVGARNLTVSTAGPVAINAGGQLLSGAGGTISVTGTGTSPTSGISVVAGGIINGNGGNVSLTGTGTDGAVGIRVQDGTVQTSGGGTVTLNGTGSWGVQVQGLAGGVSSVDGLLSITGTGNFTSAVGIVIQSAIVQATGTGGVATTGTGNPNVTNGLGVRLISSSTVSVNNGPLNITGTGRGLDDGTNLGVAVEGSTVRSMGSGTITIQGTAPGNTAAISFADTGFGPGTLMAGSGAVTLTGDIINLGAASSVSGTGTFTFQPLTASRPLQLGGSNTAGKLVFTDTDRAALANGFSQITLSTGSGGTGAVTTASNLTFATFLQVSGGAGVTITHTLDAGSNNLQLFSGGPVAVNSPGQLRTSGSGAITVLAGATLTVQSGALVQSGGVINLSGPFAQSGGTTISVAGASLVGTAANLSGSDFFSPTNANDIFNITPGGTTPITINGGSNAATPTTTASVTAGGTTVSQTLPVGDVVNINDQGSTATTAYTLTATTVQRTGTNLITLTNVESLTVNATTANFDTFTVFGTPAGTTTLNANGSDTFTVGNTAANSILTINGGTASTNTGIGTTGAGSVLVVNGGSAFNLIFTLNSGANSGILYRGGNGGNGFGVGASGTGSVTQVIGGTGTDQGGIGNANTTAGVLGKVSVDLVSGAAGTDQLYFFDQGAPGAFTYTLTATTIDRTNVGQVTYANCDVLGLNTAQGAATVQANATATGTATTIVGGPANDSFTFQAAMGGTVVLDARAGSNTLLVTAANRMMADTITFSNSGVSDAQGVLQLTYFASASGTFGGGISLLGTPFNDMIFVLSARTDGPTTVNGQGGNDSFGMVVTTQSNYRATALALVTMDGGTGTNSLSLTSTSPGATIRRTVISATSGVLNVTYPVPGLPSSISYQNFGTVITSPTAI